MYTLQELATTFTRTNFPDSVHAFENSSYGYWILPSGDIVSLHEPMSHGKVAAHLDTRIFDECMLTASQTTGIAHFKAELETTATVKRNWVRVNMNPYSSDINCNWSNVNPNQKKALLSILDTHDPDDEVTYWWDTGSGSYHQLMKAINKTMKEI